MTDTNQTELLPRGVMFLKENSGLDMLKMCNDSVFFNILHKNHSLKYTPLTHT
jgi:hypothetical protein